jgi:hypothetical protein
MAVVESRVFVTLQTAIAGKANSREAMARQGPSSNGSIDRSSFREFIPLKGANTIST